MNLLKAIADGTPRMHATGFAQLYLTPSVRLHVWTPYLFNHAPDVSQIAFKHDHRYGIESAVLRGALLDTPWTMDETYGPWHLYEVRPAHEGEPDLPHPADYGQHVSAMSGQPRIITEGNCYSIPKREFHDSRALDVTVTIMHKVDEENEWARLLVPDGFGPIHSLAKQPDQLLIKDEMQHAVSGIRGDRLRAAEKILARWGG